MPTAPAERRRAWAAPVLAAPVVVLALLLGACAGPERPASPADAGTPVGQDATTAPGDDGASDQSVGGTGDDRPVVEGLPVPPDLDEAFTTLLDQRAAALVERDGEAFVATLDQADPGFLVAQEGYFDNLAQLPVGLLSYAVDPSSLVRDDRSYSVVVEVTLQLEGFDALPSRTLDRYRFDQVGRRSGTPRYLLSSVTDTAWEEANDIQAQPWEARPVQVRRAPGVLGIFDDVSVAAARPLLRAVQRSVDDVAARVPYPWDRSVVVYALSDTRFIRSLDDLPGDEPDALDGIAFTVPAGPGDPRTVATRIVLNPRLLARSDAARDRLLRHELTHVALAERDDHAPVWLSEGLAEWVSVQALPPDERRLDAEALEAARRGVEEMPRDATFNDDDAALHYAVAWWVCEYLAATYGESAPWSVLDAFAAPATPEGPTVQALLRMSPTKLARRGTALLVDSYAPPRERDRDRDRPPRGAATPGSGPRG
jgi:hypothetical protein